MIIFPDSNLPPQSEDWGNKVEKEIKRIDKKTGGSVSVVGGGSGGEGTPGPAGPTGPQGETGPAGPRGLQGEPGLDGADGAQGIPGEKGDKGDTGDQGIPGEKGDKGDTGDQGLQGEQGLKGDTGDQGPQGEQGLKGDTGDQGPQGEQGLQGEQGVQGEQGLKGDTGDTGPQGATGATGATGDQGLNGFSAYQVAVIDGFDGTETEWLASLVGPGIATGGTAGQVLTKVDGTDYNTYWADEAPAASYTSTIKHQVKLGQAIAKGQAVYVSSSDGTNMIVSKASNAREGTSSKTLGLLETSGNMNAKVNVITEGLLAGLNTATAQAGDAVWLGIDGNLIYGLTNKPSAPAHLVSIGIVTRVNANNGEIFVKPQNGFELQELHNVQIASPAEGQALVYEEGLWVNKTLIGTSSNLDAGRAESIYLAFDTIECGLYDEIYGGLEPIDGGVQ